MSRGCCRNGKRGQAEAVGGHGISLCPLSYKGTAGWEYDYSRLEQQMLMPFPLTKQKGERKVEKSSRSASGANNGGRQEDRVVYSGDFQNNTCNLQDNRGGQFLGQSVSFQHICATCWKHTKTCAYHPASSMDCPFYEN